MDKIDEINTFEPGAMIQEVPLRTSITPAMRFGAVFDLIFNLLAAGLIGTFTLFKLRTRFEVDASRRGRK